MIQSQSRSIHAPSGAFHRARRGAASLAAVLFVAACGGTATAPRSITPRAPAPLQVTPPSPDLREGLGAGLFDAEQALWNMSLVSTTPPPEDFIGVTNSDLAFKGPYAIQGNYNGIQVWDISDPSRPELVVGYVCPASQSDVSVYGDLLFVSGEGLGGRLDCGTEGVAEAVSPDRLRGIRIFDISDIRNPRYIANVQTCRGSHTHTVLKDPDDDENVYIYVSGSAPVRPEEELPGCSGALPGEDPNTALFRIEVIKVPLARPEDAAIVSSPRIFEGLVAPPTHGLAPDDLAVVEEARARGAFIVDIMNQPVVLPDRFVGPLLANAVRERGGEGAPTAADSAAVRAALPAIIERMMGGADRERMGPNQCHDITVYPAIGRAGGACEGYGLLLDITDPVNPTRLAAVADSNFSYWHSATFNNAGTAVLFTDEWGGGGQPKCRASDPMEWGANAIFTLEGDEMVFRSYFKIPAAQTPQENCVAHNGSLIPIPGRDVMVQGWYQGGISVFDWSDPSNPVEIAYFDRGPADAERMAMGGSWSVYWYNGVIVSSEIARGLDILGLTPSEALSANEIEAARSVRLEELNAQGQPRFVWPHSFALARAYVDQLERSRVLDADHIADLRTGIDEAEAATGDRRSRALTDLAAEVERDGPRTGDPQRMGMLAEALRGLAGMR